MCFLPPVDARNHERKASRGLGTHVKEAWTLIGDGWEPRSSISAIGTISVEAHWPSSLKHIITFFPSDLLDLQVMS